MTGVQCCSHHYQWLAFGLLVSAIALGSYYGSYRKVYVHHFLETQLDVREVEAIFHHQLFILPSSEIAVFDHNTITQLIHRAYLDVWIPDIVRKCQLGEHKYMVGNVSTGSLPASILRQRVYDVIQRLQPNVSTNPFLYKSHSDELIYAPFNPVFNYCSIWFENDEERSQLMEGLRLLSQYPYLTPSGRLLQSRIISTLRTIIYLSTSMQKWITYSTDLFTADFGTLRAVVTAVERWRYLLPTVNHKRIAHELDYLSNTNSTRHLNWISAMLREGWPAVLS